MSTISTCILDTADSVASILYKKKLENMVINLSNIFDKLDVKQYLEIVDTESVVESNTIPIKY